MPSLATAALTSLVLLAPVPVLAQANDAAPSVTCSVAGYDVIIFNEGSAPVAAGTEVRWAVPFARGKGVHTLDASLEPGGRLYLSTALGASFLDPGKPCTASIG